jgi:5-methylcytosine-specific restriction endonuclease McrA
MASAERQRDYRARQRIRMAEDPEYAAKIKEQQRAQNVKQAAKRDKDAYNAYMRDWYQKTVAENPEYRERKRASGRKSYANNSEKRRAEYWRWYAEHDRSASHLKWARANADKRRESTRRRKALLKGATTIEQFTKDDVFELCQGICGICQQPVDPDNWHLDHIIPLSRGGQHTLDNVQVSHPRCNIRKKAKLPSEMADTTEVSS